jgi:hypothetical protein
MAWYKEQVKSPGIAVKSGAEIDIESGGALQLAGVSVAASAAELNVFDGAANGTVGWTLGAESGGNTRNIGIQLNDANGNPTAMRQTVFAYLSDDANGDSIASSAPSGGWAIGTDGLLIPVVANKAAMLTSEADGDIDINIVEAGAATWYVVIVVPSGKLSVSGAIAFAG